MKQPFSAKTFRDKYLAVSIAALFISLSAFSQVKVGSTGDIQPIGNYPAMRIGNYQAGSYPVTRLTERDSIPSWLRTIGMTSKVSSIDSTYQLVGGTANTNWVNVSQSLLQPLADEAIHSIPFNTGSFIMITDSYGESVGASSYINGFAYKTTRTLMNVGKSYGYATILNAANSTNGTGITTNGSYVSNGVVFSRLKLTAGQVVSITNRVFDFCDIFYNASASHGNIELRVNGVLQSTKTLSGSGIRTTFSTALTSTASQTDIVTLTATDSVEITGIQTLKQSSSSPTVFLASKSGFAYQDFNTSSAMDELATYINFTSGGSEKYIALALGTNNLYQAGARSLTPAAMITNIQTLITGLTSRCSGNLHFLITVPARANESIFPIVQSGYTYFDYRDAIVNFCRAGGYTCVRYDQTQLGLGIASYYSDGVHPLDYGHSILAAKWAEVLGLPGNTQNEPNLFGFSVASPLNSVTGKGNTTQNLIMVTGNNNIPTSGEGLNLYYDTSKHRGYLVSYNWGVGSKNMVLGLNSNTALGADFTPTAKLHLTAGAASAATAPVKFSRGAKLTTLEEGALEYDTVTNHLLFTSSGGIRVPVDIKNLDDLTAIAGRNISSNLLMVSGNSNIPSTGAGINLYYDAGTQRGHLVTYDWGGTGFKTTVINNHIALGGDFNATSKLHLGGGTSTASDAPMKFTSGVNLTTPEAGAVEYDGTEFYATPSNSSRYILLRGLKGSTTLDFPSTAAQTSSELTITVTGAADGDNVLVSPLNASSNANSCFTARVSATNTVTVKFNNYSSAAIDPASGIFKVTVIK